MRRIFVFLLILNFFVLRAEEEKVSPEAAVSVQEEAVIKIDPALDKAFLMREDSINPEMVVCADGKEPFIIGNEVTNKAYNMNKDLNESILFYSKFTDQREELRTFLRHPNHFNGKYMQTNTSDGETIHYTYFDRGSGELLVIGGAFFNQEKMAPFVKMFNKYDLIIFNHRGVEYNPGGGSIWSPICPCLFFDGLDGSKVQLGRVEEKDVFAVVYDTFKIKNYKKVYGLALCYSAPIFIKAEIMRPGTFNKLILDGAWMHIEDVLKNYTMNYSSGIFQNKSMIDVYLWLGEKFSGIQYSKLKFDFTDYVTKLDIPVLFMHSFKDRIVSNTEFSKLYSLVPSTKKAAVITKLGHIETYLKRKEMYKYLSLSFFDNDFDTFLNSLV